MKKKLKILKNERIKVTLEQTINQMNATHQLETHDLKQKIEILLEDQNQMVKNHEMEINQLKTSEAFIKKQQSETLLNIDYLNNNINTLKSQLCDSNNEIENQRKNIDIVNFELISLSELSERLSEITRHDEYKIAKDKVEFGINQYCNFSLETMTQKYASNSHLMDAEIKDIFNNYNKILAMLNISEEISTKIIEKIKYIKSIIYNVNTSNITLSNNFEKINITLCDQKKSIYSLKNKIIQLETLYDAARNNYIISLSNQIESLKNQESKIADLNNIIHENQKKYNDLIEKTTNTLNDDIEKLKFENKELKDINNKFTNKLLKDNHFNTNNILSILNKAPLNASTETTNNLFNFKHYCLEFITNMNKDHENRLKNGTKTGKLKWSWITTLKNELRDDSISNERFLHILKSLFIIYLQNKDGNSFFNAKKTTAGIDLIKRLNEDHNTFLRKLLFDIEGNIDYDDIAEKLCSETVSIEIANQVINPNQDQGITLTIDQFSPTYSLFTNETKPINRLTQQY